MPLITADHIFDGYTFLPAGTVLDVSPEGKILNVLSSGDDTELISYPGLLMPGMINAHCHLELSHLRQKIAKHQGLVTFLLSVLSLREKITPEEKGIAIAAAEEEMISNGIVAVGDISNTLDSLSQKSKGNLLYHSFVECIGLREEKADSIFENAKLIQEEFSAWHKSSLVLHAPYSVSDRLIAYLDEDSSGTISSIHNQECEAENELFKKRSGAFLRLFEEIRFNIKDLITTGRNSIQTYFPKLVHAQKIILVHNTFSSKEDVDFVNTFDKEVSWCLCPKANLFIEDVLPDIEMLWRSGCNLVLGTDSLASNDGLSIADEILTIQKAFPQIPDTDILKWACINGAKALALDEKVGSFEKGKKPGVIQLANFRRDTLPKDNYEVNRIF